MALIGKSPTARLSCTTPSGAVTQRTQATVSPGRSESRSRAPCCLSPMRASQQPRKRGSPPRDGMLKMPSRSRPKGAAENEIPASSGVQRIHSNEQGVAQYCGCDGQRPKKDDDKLLVQRPALSH